MTPFEFVFFLYAIMLSLALTHLVSGWAMALRHAKTVRWSLPHVLWALSALLMTIGNLCSFWLMRDAPSWNPWLVLSNFLFALINYVWCVFITPEAERGETLDLVAFHDAERRRYLAPLVVLEGVAIASNIANGLYASYDNWLSDMVISVIALAATLIAIIWSGNRLQVVVAAVMLAFSLFFVVSASSIIGS